MSIVLYHCRGARSLRPLWALEEMGIPYDLEVLPFPPRVHRKEFLGINTLGTVPYFVDGNVHMTESCAICQYLVERYRQNQFGLQVEHPEYGDYLNWLYHSDATITFPQAIVRRYREMEPEERRLPQAVEDYTAFFLGRLRLLDAAIAGRKYLCDGRFTIADICVGYALYLGDTLGLSEKYTPQTRNYLQHLVERPAFQRADQLGWGVEPNLG